MKIRITGASVKSYWYADAIGKVYTVEKTVESERKYLVDGGWYVNFEDCEEVIEHNSQLYRKVDRPVREGDTVLINFDGSERFKEGEIVKPIEVRPSGTIYAEHPEGTNVANGGAALFPSEYTVLEAIEQPEIGPSYAEVSELLHEAKGEEALVFLTDNHRVVAQTQQPEDIIEHNGKQYRKVKRKAAVGELVMYTGTKLDSDRGVLKVIDGGEPIDIRKETYLSTVLDDPHVVLEPIEQSGQTELDLLANLAQEVAELKRQLTHAKTDIADLEDRVDENEKDTEEVIGRMNDLGDGAEAGEDLLTKLRAKRDEALRFRAETKDHTTFQYFDGKVRGFHESIDVIKEALRNG
jgi:hypothetical protein